MPTSWLSTRSNFLNTTPNPGEFSSNLPVVCGGVQRNYRWHEHDPDQIIQACEDCIGEAVKSMTAAGYPKSNIKVIGTVGIWLSNPDG